MLVGTDLFGAAVQWDLAFCDPRLERRFQQRFERSLGIADKAHCALLLAVALFGVARMLLSGVHRSNMESLLAPCKLLLSLLAMYGCFQSSVAMHAADRQGLCRCHCGQVACQSMRYTESRHGILTHCSTGQVTASSCEMLCIQTL